MPRRTRPAVDGGRDALAGLLVPGELGLLRSLSQDTADQLAAVCLLAALLTVGGPAPVLATALSWPTAR